MNGVGQLPLAIAGSTLFIAFCYLAFKINLAAKNRSLQVVMPIIAVVYSLVLIVLFRKAQELLEGLVETVSNMAPFLSNVDTGIVVFVVFNMLAVLIFLLLKFISIAVLNRQKNDESSPLASLFGIAYEWDNVDEVWLLKNEYGQVKHLFSWMYYALILCCWILTFCMMKFPGSAVSQNVFYPVFPVLIFGEIVCFLSGVTKNELSDKLSYSDEDAKRIAQYRGLLRVFQRYEGRIVYSGILQRAHLSSVPNSDFVEPLYESDDHSEHLAGIYLRSLQRKGCDLSPDASDAMVRLMKGSNIAFMTPFYKDFSEYVMFPASNLLVRGGRVLVIVGDDMDLTTTMEWVDDSFEGITGVRGLWKTALLFGEEEKAHVWLMRMSDANRWMDANARRDCLSDVRFVLMLNPSVSLATSQIGLRLLVKMFNEHEVTYCVFDRCSNGIIDSLSHILSTHFIEVGIRQSTRGITCAAVWKSEDPEGTSLHHQLYGNIAQYLGLGTEIGSIAMKNDVDKIDWIAFSNVPIKDVRSLDKQYYRQICEYAGLQDAACVLDDHFTYKNGIWHNGRVDHGFFIVEDEHFNAFETVRHFSTRAKRDSFVNVISPNYLLRDYMGENSAVMIAEAKRYSSIAPDNDNSLRNASFALFALMVAEGMPEVDVLGFLKANGKDVCAPVEMLAELAKRYVLQDATVEELCEYIEVVEDDKVLDFETGTYCRTRTYRICKETALEESCKGLLAHAFYVSEEEDLDSNLLGSHLAEHLFQIMLPGQYVVLNGLYYEVLSIETGVEASHVFVRRASDFFTRRCAYRQLKRLCVQSWMPSHRHFRTRNISGLSIEYAEADFTVATDGYLMMNDLSDFPTARKTTLESIPTRAYRNKLAMKITVENATPKINATLTFALSELFLTLFGQDSAYIVVTSVAATRSDFPLGSFVALEGLVPEIGEAFDSAQLDEQDGRLIIDENAIYIFEDSQIDLGLLSSIDRCILQIFEILEDYFAWHEERLITGRLTQKAMPDLSEGLTVRDSDEDGEEEADGKKLGFFGRIKRAVKNLFSGFGKNKKKKGVNSDSGNSEDDSDEPTKPVKESDDPDVGECTGSDESGIAPTEKGEDAESEDVPSETDDTAGLMQSMGDSLAERFTSLEKPLEEENLDELMQDISMSVSKNQNGSEGLNLGMNEGIEDASKALAENEEEARESSVDGVSEQVEVDVASTGEPEDSFDVQNKDEIEGGGDAAVETEVESRYTGKVEENAGTENEEEDMVIYEEDGATRGRLDDEFDISNDSYASSNYLKFGEENYPQFMVPKETYSLLSQMGFLDPNLKKARMGTDAISSALDNVRNVSERQCDFCGKPLLGCEYDILGDGRERCLSCSRTTVSTAEGMQGLFEETRDEMCALFGISIKAGIQVRVTSAKEIARAMKQSFVPTAGFDARAVGVAIRDTSGGCTLLLENGAPRLNLASTIVHELTHMWQYQNWDLEKMERCYGSEKMLIVMEGMAVWASIQYLFLINENDVAVSSFVNEYQRADEYGEGLRRYYAEYGFCEDVELTKPTPFEAGSTPIP